MWYAGDGFSVEFQPKLDGEFELDFFCRQNEKKWE